VIRAALTVLIIIAAAAPVRAHALSAEAKLRGDHVEVEAYFSDNTPARGARVTVHDAANTLVAEGRTDDEGRWHCPAPPPGRYRLVVDAGDGHRTRPITVTIPATVADGAPISDAPSRDEFTSFPWLRVAAGLAIIALLAIGWRAWRRR
jgi:hypothetical protein